MPDVPGTLIYDLSGRLIYFNLKAWDLLAPSQTSPGKGGTIPPIPNEILSIYQISRNRILEKGKKALRHVDHALLNQGHRILFLRAMIMGSSGLKRFGTHILILIEPPSPDGGFNLQRAGEMFFLTRRELEVLRLIYEGNGNRTIAETLSISRYTVKDHLKHIMGKMGVSSRQQIVTTLATRMLKDKSPPQPEWSPTER